MKLIVLTSALCAAAVSTAAVAAKPATRNRAEIPAEFRWDFSAIYPGWAAWAEDMKAMDARMDEFAALQGHARRRAAGVAEGLPRLRRHRQAPVPALPLPAAAARRRHARSGGRRPLPARARRVREVRYRVGLVHARAAARSRGDRQGLDRGDAGPRAVPLHASSTATARQAHVLDDKGERLLSLAGQFNGAPRTIYQELSTSDIKFPTLKLGDGTRGRRSRPATTRRCSRSNPSQAERGKAAAAHVGTYGATANTYGAIYTRPAASATGSSPRRATSTARSTPRSTATRSRAPSSRR